MTGIGLLWIAGFALLTLWAVRAARARSLRPVARAEPVALALGVAVLAAAGALGWGSEPARRAMSAIRRNPGDRAAQSPPRARLFLHRVRVPVEPAAGAVSVGYSIEADLRLPRAYEVDEASRGWDLFVVTPLPGDLVFASVLPPPEPTDTRILFGTVTVAGDAQLEDHARAARDLLRNDRCQAGAETPLAVAGPAGAVIAVVCRGDRPIAALAFEAGEGALAVTPLIWRSGRFRPHHVQVESGSLLQIGSLVDAIPGLELWEVPSPAARAELLFPPVDVLAPCSDWENAIVGREDRPTGARDPAEESLPVCVLPFSPPFGLEVRRLVPDVRGISARSAWAAGSLIAPALALLLAISIRRRSQLTRAEIAPAIAHAWVSSLIVLFGLFRLLWAHRIDMLRDYEAVGWRVVQNQLTIALIAAALAASAAVIATAGRRTIVRATVAVGVWVAHLGLISRALAVDAELAPRMASLLGQLLLSLALGLAPLGLGLWQRARARMIERIPAAFARAVVPLAGLAVAALVARLFWPRSVFLKLSLSWSVVIASYSALRLCALRDGSSARASAVLALSLAAGACCAVLDPGITAAIVCPGFAFALVMTAHDARFADESLRLIAGYRLEHAPVAAVQIAVAFAVGLALTAIAATGLWHSPRGGPDTAWSRELTRIALHLPAIVALLVAPAAAVALQRRGRLAALPWIAVTGLALTAWTGRDAICRALMESGSQAAQRVAIILEPGYALLRDDARFLAGLTAWRETGLAPGAGLAHGQGYFGAQLLDPGVLLSIDNDYLPILLLRESGVLGVLAVAVALLIFVAGLWLIAGERFHHGSAEQRTRALAAMVLGLLAVYQPLAALGGLPLTGVAWPGLGLDSPSDAWIFVALACWIALWGSASRPTPSRGGDDPDRAIDRYDAELRGERRFRRMRWAMGGATLTVALALLAILGRTAVFAARRPLPVDTAERSVEPFDRLDRAIGYARSLRCGDMPTDAESVRVPLDLVGQPTTGATRRFHSASARTWARLRPTIVSEIEAWNRGDERACGASDGSLSFERTADGCRAVVDLGWPKVAISARREDGELSATCAIELSPEPLRALRLPPARPYRDARIRLVSRAMGVAATDRGELVSGHVTIRLRPGAGDIGGHRLDAGMYAAERVAIGGDVFIELRGDRAVLRRERGPDEEPDDSAWLFVRGPAESVQVVSAAHETWRREPSDQPEIDLAATSLLVVDGGSARSLWLFRPPSSWSDDEPTAVVNPLIADDSWTVRGERRRFYLYGNLLPEVGWVNRFRERSSVGLDGWVRVAASEYAGADSPSAGMCGTLSPPSVELDRVCAQSPVDGVLECRVALQPELEIRLAHLTELIALDPVGFAGRRDKRWSAPVRAAYTLIRGDTGELVAQSQFVPGRESSAYAPATPELEQILVRHREDRDPVTGARLAREASGEASAERVDWNAPIAVGSTLKPLLARALELADPYFARALSLAGSRFVGAECRGGRSHRVLGHCPPTDSLWNRQGRMTMAEFLAYSANWFQAALGLLGTAVPDGEWGFGAETSLPTPLVVRDVGDHQADAPLWTRSHGEHVITPSGRVRLSALRQTAMWQRFEQVLGRPLCALGSKRACERAAASGDLCAVRALPISDPTADLRRLVSLGPAGFDFYPGSAAERAQSTVSTREYLQFLRGSGVHPVASLPQLADAFNRVVFGGRTGDGSYRLGATWFPSPAVADPPRESCALRDGATTVRAGLCLAIHDGTARSLEPLLHEDGLVIYAAKTGTIDSLADLAEERAACRAFDEAHTIPDRPATASQQPYWLGCGATQRAIDDSLLLLSFGVVDASGSIVPLTLAIRFQRGGSGLATSVARHYVDVIRDYFSPRLRDVP